MAKLKIKTGDTVLVVAGDDKGQQGTVQKVYKVKNKVLSRRCQYGFKT